MNKRIILGIVFFVFLVLSVNEVYALSSYASSVTHAPRASFQAVYGSEDRLETYWPILGDEGDCRAREDLILQVAPGGCEPMVVRSDLLAEQNVPVFCQIDALQINPLIDIEQIRSISFKRGYPEGVVGAGFHPARAALRTRDKLLGSPLINNIGYIVVVLKRNEVEDDLPDFVQVNLTGFIDYDADNAYGIGKAEFILDQVSDSEWENTEERFKNSFWNGRYFVRLERAEPEYAVVALYEGSRRAATIRVDRGKISDPIWVPGAYCRAGVKVAYDGFVGDRDSAIIELGNNDGADRITVFEGSRFLNSKCRVDDLKINDGGETGFIEIKCSGGEKFVLGLKEKENFVYKRFFLNGRYTDNDQFYVSDDKSFDEDTLIVLDSGQILLNWKNVGEIKDNILKINKSKFEGVVNEDGLQESVNGLFSDLNNAVIEGDEIVTKNVDEKETGENVEFDEAISSLEKVADEYPAEREKDVEGSERYGEMALIKAIDLSEGVGEENVRLMLMNKFIDIYPDSSYVDYYRNEVNKLGKIDSSGATGVVEIDNTFRTIQVVRFDKATKKSSASFAVTGAKAERTSVDLDGVSKDLQGNEGHLKSIRLERIIDDESVVVSLGCWAKVQGDMIEQPGGTLTLRDGEDSKKACTKSNIKLEDVNLEKVVKIRLEPEARGTRTETNLSVTIGIEKRAIKLSPEKTEEMIENLNKSIEKWEDLNERLGKVVKGLKGACFATAGVLTIKNFFSGLSGEALARNKVMGGETGWNRKCSDLVSVGTYSSLSQCYLENADLIDADVDKAEGVINQVNTRIETIESRYPSGSSGFLGMGEGVDRTKSAIAYCNELKSAYVGRKINDKNVESILGDCEKGYEEGWYSYNDLREMEYNLLLREKGVSDNLVDNSESLLLTSSNNIFENKKRSEEILKAQQNANLGLPSNPIISTSNQRKNVIGEVVRVEGVSDNVNIDKTGVSHLTSVWAYSSENMTIGDKKYEGFKPDTYLLGLQKSDEGYSVQEVYKKNGENNYEKLEGSEKGEFLDIYGIGTITSTESVTYYNSYENPEVRYYEREPYKGMPAVVPFDKRNGWYAATKQTLPAFGGTASFDESGRVMSFYLCNVGKNNREQFFEGIGDDICQQINLNTGQPLGFFPNLGEREARQKVSEAIDALNEAARQYGNKRVNIKGQDFLVGSPAASIPSMQCQNFMSPRECHLLFNVCDPVICPPSRCDFGGKFPVADVVQTGIIGSTLLCLPNVKEKIAIPVCLTGIHAGIEGFVSIMRNHRDCLQESLETGRMIGVCDQIYSIYLCEFFWRQVAPIAKVILPKIVEGAYGQGTRGGGEYLSVMGAWQNMENSVNYFTQTYGVNSLKAFQSRNIEEVGTEFCKAYISAKAPTSFESLIEPDSPPQFHAWFSSNTYSDVTVPATSQYKVFYHIFAGKDQGVHYSVYLKNPPESSYYAVPAVVHVASGFVGRGQYASETRDFTAPEGYKEMCVRVNDQEECGFKQVSTSFALNYLRDGVVSDEIGETNIQGESECISGSVNLGSALLNPNVQAGAEEAAFGGAYERGIVRICATQNPGSQTDPSRFVEVGVCDDPKIKCWLDKQSVENAISDNNKGVKDTTLEELEKTQRDRLAQAGVIVGDDVANSEIFILEKEIESMKTGQVVQSKVDELLKRLDGLFDKVILNHHRANILYMIGDLRAFVVWTRFEGNVISQSVRNGYEGVVIDSNFGEEDSENNPEPEVKEEIYYRLGDFEKVGTLDTRFVYLQDQRLEVMYVELSRSVIAIYNPDGSFNVVGNIESDGTIVMLQDRIDALELDERVELVLNDFNGQKESVFYNGEIVAMDEVKKLYGF